eukprot:TRINITY_DN19_c6_g1_i12.p1 TRINITY_DN19_c6_g1~~TRINITY_DN19_c6_g1_i12.p1  ORF type:complete len:222 (+),score=-29.19 TRINITY_DN19_c6_g1_i12:954-1619(+)
MLPQSSTILWVIEVPNRYVDTSSWQRSACYPQSNFYPLSDGPSTRNRRITKADFRPCSTCWSCSQAPFCLCTLQPISVRLEGTFARLRYLLGVYRPSKTAHLQLSNVLFQGIIIRILALPEWSLTVGSRLPESKRSQPPTQTAQEKPEPNCRLQQSFIGSFCPGVGNQHLHQYFYFTESISETVPRSLRLSCGPELTWQGISLPQDRQSYDRRSPGLRSPA